LPFLELPSDDLATWLDPPDRFETGSKSPFVIVDLGLKLLLAAAPADGPAGVGPLELAADH